MNDTAESIPQAPRWLLLIHSIPPKPDYFRVKIRRRLQKLGAVPLKSSVYALPNNDESLEDFQWLARAIEEEGGEAMVCEATFIEGITDGEIEAMLEQPQATAKTWVTREGVKVDRMASAWLIRKFIDPGAQFRFVPARGYQPQAGEVRFDMFGGEYTHEGDRCTFETLCAKFTLADPALRALGEIVHDIDCKDEKFGRAEAQGVASMINGIVAGNAADPERLRRGAALFDDLYASFARA
jgi:hypothetical protein